MFTSDSQHPPRSKHAVYLGEEAFYTMQRQYIVKIIWNVSDWLSYSGGALIKVPDSAGSTVHYKRQVPLNCVCH